MKHLLLILFLFLGGAGFAQEGVKVKGNTLTTKEIPPVWPGCEDAAIEKKVCFKQKLTEHLKKNYKFPKDAQGNLVRGKAIVSFNVDEEGKIEILAVEGPKKELNAEAKRIILAIPQMKPGERAGKPVAIKYKVPFVF
jgi:protein TonB